VDPESTVLAGAESTGGIMVGGYSLDVDLELRTFPSSDRDFGAFAHVTLLDLAEPRSPEAFQRRLRSRYPAAIVKVQVELARHGEGPSVWYAFRSGSVGAAPIVPVNEAPAWAIVDDERRFVEVSPALAAIIELPAAMIVGHAVEEFGGPDDPTIRSDLLRLWKDFQTTGAIASTVRFNFGDGRPRELGYRLIADAAGPGRHRLTVWELATD
jgi:PAS domain-containing protein